MATLERRHWLVAGPDGFDLYTDHNNLIFLFDPLSVVAEISQTTLRKVLGWAVRLSVYNYTSVHMKVRENVWADLLGRWSAPATVRRLVHVPVLPSFSSSYFEWLAVIAIGHEQHPYSTNRPVNLVLSGGIWKTESGAVWIPDDSYEIQLLLCVITHTGPAGHRGVDSTLHSIGPSFHWTTMDADFDYIELGSSTIWSKYVLMLRDDHSGYLWFFEFPDTCADNAATAIIDWSAAFGVPRALMSDGPTHFRNETICLISKGLNVSHHFTLPYCPWSNGAIERIAKELFQIAHAVLSELQHPFEDWPDILPLIHSVRNKDPSPQRRNVAPVTAFNGSAPTPPIRTFVRSVTSTVVTVPDLVQERVLNVEALIRSKSELFPVFQKTLEDHRQDARSALARVNLPNLDIGDYMLVSRSDFFAGEKRALRWPSPCCIVATVSDYVYTVQDIRNGTYEDCHISRLKFYSDKDVDETVLISHIVSSETGIPVSRLMRLEEDRDGLKVVIRWKGLPESENTLEPILRVYEDVPQMLHRLLARKNTPLRLFQKARSQLVLKRGECNDNERFYRLSLLCIATYQMRQGQK